jgi:hypothetical protein
MKQSIDNKTFDLEDILVWPDGMWYYRYEAHEAGHKSDDFDVLFVDTPEWLNFERK